MTPGQLVKAVALALDVREETVVRHDRNLVVAGLRTKGGRGPSAPSVTTLDAARLFVATLASIKIRGSEQVVRRFEDTKFTAPQSDADTFAMFKEVAAMPQDIENKMSSTVKFKDVAIMRLPREHNFVEAIASLIGDAGEPVNDYEHHLERFCPLWITCELPWARARIGHWGFTGSRAGYDVPLKTSAKSDQKRDEMPLWARHVNGPGITQRRESTGTALVLLGLAFRENGLDFRSRKEAVADLIRQASKKPARRSVAVA
jgi:hypothetical protein